MPRQILPTKEVQKIIDTSIEDFNARLRTLPKLVSEFDGSVAQMARSLFFSPSKMNSILNKGACLKLEEVFILLHYFGVKAEWLFYGEGEALEPVEEEEDPLKAQLSELDPDELKKLLLQTLNS